MRRRIHVICMSSLRRPVHKELVLSYEEEDTCHMRRRIHVI